MKPGALPLEGLLVLSLEQAVAAPYCSSRLADAGARVIKVERPEGDFARGHNAAVSGHAALTKGSPKVGYQNLARPILSLKSREEPFGTRLSPMS
jgi:crotonobetainyl-CoA:carnitine CoA-transferase CaiB-like acyl-CoA transferase